MELVSVALATVAFWLVLQALRPLLWHARLSYSLREIPYVEPPHWLWGHLNEAAKPNTDEERWKRWTAHGERLTRFRVFHRQELAVVHPETVAVLLRTAEPKGKEVYGLIRAWLGNGLLISSGARWSRDRRLLTRGFHFDILSGYFPVYQEATNIMLEQWAEVSRRDGQAVNLTRSAKLLTLDIILRCIMSYESDCQNPNAEGKVVDYANAVQQISQCIITRFVHPWEYPDFLFYLSKNGRQFSKLKKISDATSHHLISERRRLIVEDKSPDFAENSFPLNQNRKGRKYLDFLDILLTVRDENGTGMSDKEIQEQVDTFLFEGHDTTAIALQWTLYFLAKNPEIQEKCRQEAQRAIGEKSELSYNDIVHLNYLTQCIKESQRLCSTVPYIFRTLTQPLIIDGHKVPAKTTIVVPIIAVHRHPDVWEKPLEFNPERFSPETCAERNPFAYIPFSAGPRNCIGQSLAMEELKTVIAMALLKFRLASDPDVAQPKINGLLVSRPSEDIMVYAHEL